MRFQFDERVKELKRFKEKHHHCDVTNSSKEYSFLGIWSSSMRSEYNGTGSMKIEFAVSRRLGSNGV